MHRQMLDVNTYSTLMYANPCTLDAHNFLSFLLDSISEEKWLSHNIKADTGNSHTSILFFTDCCTLTITTLYTNVPSVTSTDANT